MYEKFFSTISFRRRIEDEKKNPKFKTGSWREIRWATEIKRRNHFLIMIRPESQREEGEDQEEAQIVKLSVFDEYLFNSFLGSARLEFFTFLNTI